MSLDPFEARMQFLGLLKNLNASQPSIQKVVSFAIKYGSRCGEDLWECIVEVCDKSSLNARINILYFLDTLIELSLPIGNTEAPYPEYISKHLGELVDRVVPDSREGILNLKSAKQILESWRMKRLIDPNVIDGVLVSLEGRKHRIESTKYSLPHNQVQSSHTQKRSHQHAFSKNEILQRMEEDRERHKRLRERIWILPIPSLHPSTSTSTSKPLSSSTSSVSQASPSSPFTPASPSRRPTNNNTSSTGTTGTIGMPPPPPPPPSRQAQAQVRQSQRDALEIEFDQSWDNVSDLDEEDYSKIRSDMRIADSGSTTTTTTTPIR